MLWHFSYCALCIYPICRVRSGESLFDTPWPAQNRRSLKPCKCTGTTENGIPGVECPNVSPARRANRHFTRIEPVQKRFSTSKGLKTGEADDYSDDIEDINYSFDHGENYTPPAQSWPTPSGITESAAESACDQAARQSAVFSQCQSTMSNESMASLLAACKIDIQVFI